jgi:hypothetical protein
LLTATALLSALSRLLLARLARFLSATLLTATALLATTLLLARFLVRIHDLLHVKPSDDNRPIQFKFRRMTWPLELRSAEDVLVYAQNENQARLPELEWSARLVEMQHGTQAQTSAARRTGFIAKPR